MDISAVASRKAQPEASRKLEDPLPEPNSPSKIEKSLIFKYFEQKFIVSLKKNYVKIYSMDFMNSAMVRAPGLL